MSKSSKGTNPKRKTSSPTTKAATDKQPDTNIVPILGTHISSSKGFLGMGEMALSIGANTFQYFPRNPRGSKAKAFDPEDAAALHDFLKQNNFGSIVAHAPYTMNLCSPDDNLRELAKVMMAEDLERMNSFPGNVYNIHPGSRVSRGLDEAIGLIAEAINAVLKPETAAMLLLETMSGKGTEVGGTFAELRSILEQVKLRDKVGVCFDTCHLFAAGYDIVNDLEGVLEEFDRTIGLQWVRAVHINDSMHVLGSHKDRHAKVGEGEIGLEALARFMVHPVIRCLPLITETPVEMSDRAAENAFLRKVIAEHLV